jgi:hypothetical protein
VSRTNGWQVNQWGKTLEAQRSDLWLVDLDPVVKAFRTAELFNDQEDFYGTDTSFYATAVSLPELKVSPDVIRRDSRPYNMPGCDDPLEAIRVTFIHDVGTTDSGGGGGFRSEIMKILTIWRAIVRAGRGGMSVEDSFILNAYYSTMTQVGGVNQPLHAHNIPIYFLKGAGTPGKEIDKPTTSNRELDDATLLETSTKYVLQSAWLSSFKISDLSYDKSSNVTVTATFYADDISIFTGKARRYMVPL